MVVVVEMNVDASEWVEDVETLLACRLSLWRLNFFSILAGGCLMSGNAAILPLF